LTYFLTYLYLFSNKCAKYQLSKILVFLMYQRPAHSMNASCLSDAKTVGENRLYFLESKTRKLWVAKRHDNEGDLNELL
jgi:hypothetical protein